MSVSIYSLIGSRIRAFDWYRHRRPWTA